MVGIIAEYNPFHNGHIYHIQKVKELFKDKVIVLVLAGHFLNRGEISIINKWDKTKIALEYGVDLVVELPFAFASQAADIYAYGAITILDCLGCEYIVFGSESNDITKLNKLANMEETKEFKSNFQNKLQQGYNYPKALAMTLKDQSSLEVNSPNDLLGISYIKAINKLHSQIKAITIQRTNNYHDLNLLSRITSASSIRKAYHERKSIVSYLPLDVIPYMKDIDINILFPILKHQIIIDDISKYQTVDIKLAAMMKKHILDSYSMDEFITKVKTKNYTYNRIKRSIVHILCGFTKDEFVNKIEYIRVLGFNQKGKSYLHEIKKRIDIPIYTNYDKIMKLELRVSQIYALLTNDDIIKKETSHKPIMK